MMTPYNPSFRGSAAAPTTGYSPQFILNMMILEDHDLAIQELRVYYRRNSRGSMPQVHNVKSRIISLYLRVYSSLKRSLQPEAFKDLSTKVKSEKIEDLSEAFLILSDFLDEKKIIRFDGRANIDTTNPEEENLFHNL